MTSIIQRNYSRISEVSYANMSCTCPNSIMPKPFRKSDCNAKDTKNVWFQLCQGIKRFRNQFCKDVQNHWIQLCHLAWCYMPPSPCILLGFPAYQQKALKEETILILREKQSSKWPYVFLFWTLAAVIRSSTRVETKACWDSSSYKCQKNLAHIFWNYFRDSCVTPLDTSGLWDSLSRLSTHWIPARSVLEFLHESQSSWTVAAGIQ